MKSMTKTANILKKVFSVLFWVVIVIGVVLFVSLLAMLLFREAWLTDKLIHIDLGSFSFKLNLYYTADQVRALVSLLKLIPGVVSASHWFSASSKEPTLMGVK